MRLQHSWGLYSTSPRVHIQAHSSRTGTTGAKTTAAIKTTARTTKTRAATGGNKSGNQLLRCAGGLRRTMHQQTRFLRSFFFRRLPHHFHRHRHRPGRNWHQLHIRKDPHRLQSVSRIVRRISRMHQQQRLSRRWLRIPRTGCLGTFARQDAPQHGPQAHQYEHQVNDKTAMQSFDRAHCSSTILSRDDRNRPRSVLARGWSYPALMDGVHHVLPVLQIIGCQFVQ